MHNKKHQPCQIQSTKTIRKNIIPWSQCSWNCLNLKCTLSEPWPWPSSCSYPLEFSSGSQTTLSMFFNFKGKESTSPMPLFQSQDPLPDVVLEALFSVKEEGMTVPKLFIGSFCSAALESALLCSFLSSLISTYRLQLCGLYCFLEAQWCQASQELWWLQCLLIWELLVIQQDKSLRTVSATFLHLSFTVGSTNCLTLTKQELKC